MAVVTNAMQSSNARLSRSSLAAPSTVEGSGMVPF
jgi:hypothetical protein